MGNKHHTFYFFNNLINIENFSLNDTQINASSNKNILGVNTLNLIFKSKLIKVFNVSSYYWKQRKIKKYEELWSKIKDLIRSIIKISDDYDEK